jgi:hypothetical protein
MDFILIFTPNSILRPGKHFNLVQHCLVLTPETQSLPVSCKIYEKYASQVRKYYQPITKTVVPVMFL